MKKSVIMMLALTALVGCSKIEPVQEVDVNGNPIGEVPVELTGVINTVTTRGDGVIENVSGKPASALNVNVYRANATAGTTYGSVYDFAFTGVFGTDGKIAMTPKQYYLPDATRNSKFIAVYPQGGTYAPADRTIDYVIDGSTDILSGSLIQGNKSTPAGAASFSHLLTQVKVQVRAESEGLAEAWGSVTGITIGGKAVTAQVVLPDPSTAAVSTKATVRKKEGSSEAALAVIPTHTEGAGLAITTTAKPYGYALFLPSTGTLALNITAGGVDTPKTTGSLTWAAATAYTITILFKDSGGVDIETGAGEGTIGDYDPVDGGTVEVD